MKKSILLNLGVITSILALTSTLVAMTLLLLLVQGNLLLPLCQTFSHYPLYQVLFIYSRWQAWLKLYFASQTSSISWDALWFITDPDEVTMSVTKAFFTKRTNVEEKLELDHFAAEIKRIIHSCFLQSCFLHSKLNLPGWLAVTFDFCKSCSPS